MKKRSWALTSAQLHLLAMGLMLCDHLWATVVPGNDWLTCIGRLAFPIFAFLIVEGYVHTSNLRRYCLRLFCFALVTEIPFNLMVGSRVFFPIHQNVLWTFLLALGLIHWNEKAKNAPLWRRLLRAASTVVLAILAGTLTFVDYFGPGVLTVLVFYFFRGRNWQNFLCQLAALWYIHSEMLAGLSYEIAFFGKTLWIAQQSFAVLALIPIWLYRGEKGHKSRAFQYFCYSFYPAHMLILALLKML